MKQLKFAWLLVVVLVLAACGQQELTTEPGLSVLDNVKNDITADNGLDTFTLGGSTTIAYRVDRTGSQCNPTITPMTLTISQPAGVTATPNTLTFIQCDVSQNVKFEATTSGERSISVTITSGGNAGNGYSTSPATFTLKVRNPAPTCTAPDAPVISPTSPNGSNGWFKTVPMVSATSTTSDATISYSTDGENFSSTAPTLADGVTTVYTKATSGTCVSSSLREFKVDSRVPEISGSDVNNTTWRNTALSQSFTASDPTPGSGLANSADASFILDASAESTNASTPTIVTKDVTDIAGNSTTRTLSALIDLTKPTSSVTGVINGDSYTLGSVPAAGCFSSDNLSGIATPATLSPSGGPVGSVTVSCNGAVDGAGNVQTEPSSVTYNVHYDFGNWQAPLNALPTRNVVKAGRAIPVKFSLGGNQGLDIFATVSSTSTVKGPVSSPSTCSTAGTDPVEETSSAGSSSLSYDANTDTYTYVWKSDSAWAGKCRTFKLNLKDGSNHEISFQFTK